MSIRAVLLMIPYTLVGIASGAGGAIGLGPLAGAFVLGTLIVHFRPPPTLTAFLAAIVVMFMVGALFRSMSGADQASTSRYVILSCYMPPSDWPHLACDRRSRKRGPSRSGVAAAVLDVVTVGLTIRTLPLEISRRSGRSATTWCIDARMAR